MATISNTPRPGYIYDTTDGVWYPIGTGAHSHNEVPKTIVDAKGDLIVGTANDTVARQAVGADGSVLVADSTQTNGVNWVGQLVTRNAVLNSNFSVWQRGTSFSLAASTGGANFTADRWATQTYANEAITVSRQLTNDTTNLPNIQYCLRYQRNSGQTGTSALYLIQPMETVNSIPYVGKSITFSFYARAGANYSAASSVLAATIVSGTGTDQNPLTVAYTGSATVASVNAALTTTWQRFTATGTVGATATELQISFAFTPTGTAGAADYFEITGVQLELGSVASPYQPACATYQAELAACQRYYYRLTSTNTRNIASGGLAASSTRFDIPIALPVSMRVSPTSVDYSNLSITESAANYTPSSWSIDSNCALNAINLYSGGFTGLTAKQSYILFVANGYLGFNSEL